MTLEFHAATDIAANKWQPVDNAVSCFDAAERFALRNNIETGNHVFVRRLQIDGSQFGNTFQYEVTRAVRLKKVKEVR